MTTFNKLVLGGVASIVLAAAAYYFDWWAMGEESQEAEQLTAEQVVDLEVQAQQEFEAAGGMYE